MLVKLSVKKRDHEFKRKHIREFGYEREGQNDVIIL